MGAVAEMKADETPAPAAGVKRPRIAPHAPIEAQHHRRTFWMKAPPEATREDVSYMEFWGGVQKYLQRHDIVHVLADDEGWELEVCIEAVRTAGCEISVRKSYSRKPIASTSTPLGDNHRSEWRAGMGWCVVRVSDGAAVLKGLQSEAAAVLEWQKAQPRKVA